MDFHKTFTTAEYVDTGDGSRRHLGITSKGAILYAFRQQGNLIFWASAPSNNGDTIDVQLSSFAGSITHGGDMSFFIDEVDNVHLAYAKYVNGAQDGRTIQNPIIYRHGVLNSTHTAITWGPEVQIVSGDYWHCPDVVAHVENGKIQVHVVFNYNWSGDNRHITVYNRLLVNINDVNTSTIQATTFIHDVTGAQTYHGRVNIELRHGGDGKTPQLVNGVRTPDLFITWTSSNVLHYAKLAYSGGSWGAAQVIVLDGNWGCTPSAPGSFMMGLYEHHRWLKILYDPVSQQVIVVGWVQNGNFAQQSLVIWELPVGSMTRNVAWGFGNWTANNALPCMISGTATLAPDGNVHMIGNTGWYDTVGWGTIARPKGSLTRTYTFEGTVHSGNDSSGCQATMLQYPQGEHHMMYRYPNGYSWYWRNNRCADWTFVTGTGWARRPTFAKRTDGNWVPVATQRP